MEGGLRSSGPEKTVRLRCRLVRKAPVQMAFGFDSARPEFLWARARRGVGAAIDFRCIRKRGKGPCGALSDDCARQFNLAKRVRCSATFNGICGGVDRYTSKLK